MKSGHWVEVGGTFLIREFVGLEEAEGGFHRWRVKSGGQECGQVDGTGMLKTRVYSK